MDYKHLNKPQHVKEQIWRQHLEWIELGAKQIEENIRHRQKQVRYQQESKHLKG